MRHHLHAVPIAVVAGLALGMSTAVGFADAKPAPTTPPAAASASAVTTEKACTLSSSLTHKGGELTSCLAVGTKLSTVPAVGGTATLTVTVKAARAEKHTQVTIDLPTKFTFADGTATHAAYSGSGPVKRTAPTTLSLAAGQTKSFTRVVKATGSGFGEIAASASNRLSAKRTDSGKDSVFVTVGATRSASKLGAAAGSEVTRTSGSTARAHYTGAAPQRASSKALRSVPATARASRQASPNTANAPGTSCAAGNFYYLDQNGVTRALHNIRVQVRNTAGTVLTSGFTGGDGSYNLCYATGGATTTIYLTFIEENGVWRVEDYNNNIYNYSTPTTTVPDGTTHNFGGLLPGVPNQMRAAHAFQEADDEYQWMYQFVPYQGGCWSPLETTCRTLAIHWATGVNTTDGTSWNASRQVYLNDGSPDTLDEPVHEYGHDLMYELYGQTFPTTDCTTHDLFVVSGAVCGWTEGFADWVSTSVYNNTVWTYNGGGQRDFNVTWNEGLGYATGDHVEGRVVQAVRSLTDGTKGPWDHDPGEGGGIKDNSRWFHLMHDFRPNTFADVWNARASEGYDVSQTALSALYQGTIDYGFRNPLANYAGQHLPEAVPDHNYSYATSTGYWSVVAVKPDAGTDVDLTLYNDFGQSSALGSSGFGGTATDFVAVNSNNGHRALQSYYPRAHQFAGTGGYTIGVAQGQDLVSSSSTRFLSSSDPTHVWDTSETAGVPVYYRAVSDSGQDLQLFSLGAGNDILGRGSAVGGADGGGDAATLNVTPSAGGFAGLVVLNNSLTSGNVTVYKDTTAPTGSVSINNGAATTTTPDVTLTLSASDSETGVDAMQISTDGTFDTEPVVSYATSATTTLPAPNGTKTVYVRYRNNAGQWSDPVTDTINLKAVVVTSVTPASGPTTGGNTVTIAGDNFLGATAVKFSSTSATSFTVVNNKKITAVVPAHAAGLSNVSVTAPGGKSDTVVGDRYTYAAAPSVTSLSPNSGTTAGGNTVTILGSGFTGTTAVKFGSTAATSFTVVSNSKITAVVPAHAVGGTYVYVTSTGGTTVAGAGARYTYAAVPTVTGVSPASGTTAGGQTITITGTGFTGATAVKFGSGAAASFTVVSSVKITAVTPAHAAGGTNVTVTTGGGTSATSSAARYTFG